MAIAKAREVTKTRTVEESYSERDGVVLELTNDEAAYLVALIGWHVAGKGPVREMNSDIWSALRAAGFDYLKNDRVNEMRRIITGMVAVNG